MFESLLKFCSDTIRRFFSFFARDGPNQLSLTFPQVNCKVKISTTIVGEGGFSTVYRGKDADGKQYAVKKVLVQTEEIQHSMRTELKALRQFQHPQILPLIDWFETRNERNVQVFFLLFPLMKEGTLRDELNASMASDPRREKKDINRVIRGFESICTAFHYMHTFSPKYIHQDIKPENILIADDGSPLLTDFGSVREAEIHIDTRAKALAVAEQAAQFCTMPYRAIELFDPPTGSHLDARTDVWGMGCLLFAWWFGYSPYECEFTTAGHVKVVECSLSRVLSKLPRPTKPSNNDQLVVDLCEWILIHNPTERPHCRDVLERLKRITVTANQAKLDPLPV